MLADSDLPHLDLDTIAWAEPGVRLPLAASIAALEAFARTHDAWVIEGSYASVAEAALPSAPKSGSSDQFEFRDFGVPSRE